MNRVPAMKRKRKLPPIVIARREFVGSLGPHEPYLKLTLFQPHMYDEGELYQHWRCYFEVQNTYGPSWSSAGFGGCTLHALSSAFMIMPWRLAENENYYFVEMGTTAIHGYDDDWESTSYPATRRLQSTMEAAPIIAQATFRAVSRQGTELSFSLKIHKPKRLGKRWGCAVATGNLAGSAVIESNDALDVLKKALRYFHSIFRSKFDSTWKFHLGEERSKTPFDTVIAIYFAPPYRSQLRADYKSKIRASIPLVQSKMNSVSSRSMQPISRDR